MSKPLQKTPWNYEWKLFDTEIKLACLSFITNPFWLLFSLSVVQINGDNHNQQRYQCQLRSWAPNRGRLLQFAARCPYGLIWIKELSCTNAHILTNTPTHKPPCFMHPWKTSTQPLPTPNSSKQQRPLATLSCYILVFQRTTWNLKTFCFWQSRTENLSGKCDMSKNMCHYQMRFTCMGKKKCICVMYNWCVHSFSVALIQATIAFTVLME